MENNNKSSKKKSWKRKISKFVFFVVLIFLLAGVSSVITDNFIFPWISSQSWFEKQDFFKQALDNVTVINKTEQVTVSESGSLASFTEKSASSVVEIVARPANSKNISPSSVQTESGIIVTADGLVASFGEKFFSSKDTNYQVFTQDGKSFSAQVAAVDPYSDVVLLKLDGAQNLPVAEFIAPEDIKTGTKTVFMGRSGFNSELSLRFGISSELAKAFSLSGPLASSEKLQGVIFSDLNSRDALTESMVGAAAVDQNGNNLGILGSRKSDAGMDYFIVPVNHLQFVINEYLDRGEIKRATLGIYYVALSKEIAYQEGNNFDHGALVYSPSGQQGLAVLAGSPADAAGIKIGDIILSVNGDEINPDQNLAYLISKYKPRDTVSLKIHRNSQEMEVKVVLN